MAQVKYYTHQQSFGWQENPSSGGEISGIVDKSLRLEAIQLFLEGDDVTEDQISCSAWVQNTGCQQFIAGSSDSKHSTFSGTTGKSVGLTGICINLADSLTSKYYIKYSVYQNNIWYTVTNTDNSTTAYAGTCNSSSCITAVQIELVERVSYKNVTTPTIQDWQYRGSLGQPVGTIIQNSDMQNLITFANDLINQRIYGNEPFSVPNDLVSTYINQIAKASDVNQVITKLNNFLPIKTILDQDSFDIVEIGDIIKSDLFDVLSRNIIQYGLVDNTTTDDTTGELISYCTGGCRGLCTTMCSTGCRASCSSGCGNGCSSNCSGETRAKTTNCGAACMYSCSTTCDTACTSCKGCSNACYNNCSGACANTCNSWCVGGCANWCEGSCANICGKCGWYCTWTCSGTCRNSCGGKCNNSCKGACSKQCTTNCQTVCQNTCSNNTCKTNCSAECAVSCGLTCEGNCVTTNFQNAW